MSQGSQADIDESGDKKEALKLRKIKDYLN